MHTLFTHTRIDTIKKYLLYGFLFFLPTQLATFFFLPISYIDGLRIDYLAPALYLTDIFAVMMIIFNWQVLAKSIKEIVPIKWIFLGFLIAFIIQIDTAMQPLITLYRVTKVIEVFVIFLIIRKSSIPYKMLINILLAAAITQLSISTYQVLTGHSVQGGAYFLGERSFSLSTPGIAKVAINGVEILRGYGTFSHPNSLAGFYLLLYAFVLHSKKIQGTRKYLFLAISTLLIVLTFSKVAMLGVLLLSAYYAIRNLRNCTICMLSRIAVPFFLTVLLFSAQGDADSLQKRVWLTESAMKIIKDHLLTGVGLGNYLYAQGEFPIPYSYVFLQPVHNIFLLLIAEIGVPFFVFITYFFTKYIKDRLLQPQVQAVLFVLILTGMLDHYWLTLQQNVLLLPVVFGLLQTHEHVVK